MSVARNDSALRLTHHVTSQVIFPPVVNIKKLSFLMSSCGRGTRRSTPHHTCRDPSTPGPPTFTRSPHLPLHQEEAEAGDKGRPAVQTVGGSYQHIYLIEIRAPIICINGPPVLQLLEIWNLKRRTKSVTLMGGLFLPLPSLDLRTLFLIGTQRKNWFPSLTEWKPLFCKEKKNI